ncbi:glucokinase [Pullulanibacillus camelliae]|uniref:Glucokinase n=1 Tax=Pullulanibacillus camelliae TaxID=1707096 RepID=A0A8J3DY67_9BACL|nr:ROK family glucokinase [Pullulanibacillus camelliae]GGE46813.1 glucokinase [Pullulanibacillus camelliae]
MEKKKWTVGVDLGGTSIKMAFIDETGAIIDKWEIGTDLTDNGANITRDIANSLDEQLQKHAHAKEEIIGIGMGAPGFINFEDGSVFEAVNIGWKNFPLKAALEKATALPVAVDNDANLAALGEMWKGAGEGAIDLICITLGTGVGAGVIINGQIAHGIGGMAGEIGHITAVSEGGYLCNCGRTGCLETVTSATAIKRMALKDYQNHPESKLYAIYQDKQDVTTKDVFDAAKEEDPFALSIVDEVARYLGEALSNVAILLNPQKIVIGGGVSLAGETLLKPVDHYIKAFTLPGVYEGLELCKATLGNDAGVIGGAWLINKQLKRI